MNWKALLLYSTFLCLGEIAASAFLYYAFALNYTLSLAILVLINLFVFSLYAVRNSCKVIPSLFAIWAIKTSGSIALTIAILGRSPPNTLLLLDILLGIVTILLANLISKKVKRQNVTLQSN